MPRIVTPDALTRAAFAPFGDLLVPGEAPLAINQGHTAKHAELARLALTADGGRPAVHLYVSRPLPAPVTIRVMERHPLSSQLFQPLGDAPWLVVVAPPGDLDPAAIRVFRAAPDQGVNFHPGTWHHFCLALQVPSRFLVLDREGPGHDLDEVELAPAEQLVIEP